MDKSDDDDGTNLRTILLLLTNNLKSNKNIFGLIVLNKNCYSFAIVMTLNINELTNDAYSPQLILNIVKIYSPISRFNGK